MFPGVDGFHWTLGHVIFLALFFGVALTIVGTVIASVIRSARDLRTGEAAAIRWHSDFEELPDAERRCRHELAGRIQQRTCPNAFDCRHCPDYARFAAIAAVAGTGHFGLHYPDDRLYHRGHTWVRLESDGACTVGLDDVAQHLIGRPDVLKLPAVGTELTLQATAWEMGKNGREIRIRAPLDGTVLETGSGENDWYLKVRPKRANDLRHLLRGPEVSAWLACELDRLQIQLGQSASMADGGMLASDLMDAMPKADWESALAATFLEP